MCTQDAAQPVPAWIVLPGHPDTPARVEVVQYSPMWRASRTLALFAAWGGLTAATFFVTLFDPFMTSLPLIVGAAQVWRSATGRFSVTDFQGSCPRCSVEMQLKAGTKVSVPHPMVCYTCHHEAELVFRVRW